MLHRTAFAERVGAIAGDKLGRPPVPYREVAAGMLQLATDLAMYVGDHPPVAVNDQTQEPW